MCDKAEAIEKMARIYANRHEHRAVILVSDHISRAIGAGEWDRAQRWQDVRSCLWRDYGMTI